MKRLFRRAQKSVDYSTYFGDSPPTSRKQALLNECERLDVSIHIDDASETSSGVYAQFRGVASEAELERRLNAKKALERASWANAIAILALLVAVAALIKSFDLSMKWF